jgi:hypothetical protein
MASTGAIPLKPDFDPRMLALLKEIYEQEPQIRSENDIYRRFARSGVTQERIDSSLNDLIELMQGVWYIRRDFPKLRCTLQGLKRSFDDAVKDVLAVSQNQATDEQKRYANQYLNVFFYLQPTGSREVMARVGIHILAPYVKNALTVGRALASGWDKLQSFKVSGPAGAWRTDQIVAYLYSAKDLDVIDRLLTEGHTSGCIGGNVPPAMKQVRPGVGFAEEPPNVPKSYVTEDNVTIKNPDKYDRNIHPPEVTNAGFTPKNNQRMSFGEFHSNRIWAGLVQWRSKYSGTANQTIRFHGFLYEVYLAYGRKKVDLAKPYEFPGRESTEAKWRKTYFMNWTT